MAPRGPAIQELAWVKGQSSVKCYLSLAAVVSEQCIWQMSDKSKLGQREHD